MKNLIERSRVTPKAHKSMTRGYDDKLISFPWTKRIRADDVFYQDITLLKQ